ncbi:MAG: Uma2 family endonuclease [Isosphaeraceae bacterium]
MSTIASPPRSSLSAVPPSWYRITVDEYERIGQLLDDPRVELIDGYLVKKMPKKPEHEWTTKKVQKTLDSRLPSGWTSQKEAPVRLPAYDEPEPDVAIIRGSDDDYKHRTAVASDVALLVEVSESSLSQDRCEKLLAYARGGIPVYWIVNLVDRQVEVYTSPGSAGYQSHQVYATGDVVPVVINGHACGSIAVNDILP